MEYCIISLEVIFGCGGFGGGRLGFEADGSGRSSSLLAGFLFVSAFGLAGIVTAGFPWAWMEERG